MKEASRHQKHQDQHLSENQVSQQPPEVESGLHVVQHQSFATLKECQKSGGHQR